MPAAPATPTPDQPKKLTRLLQAAITARAEIRLRESSWLQMSLTDCKAVSRAAAMEVMSITPEIVGLPELRQAAWQAADQTGAAYWNWCLRAQQLAREEELPEPPGTLPETIRPPSRPSQAGLL